jgi:hypothetical protein
MAVYGLILKLTNLTTGKILLDDIFPSGIPEWQKQKLFGGVDGMPSYLAASGTMELPFTDFVALSYSSGKIRAQIAVGHISAEFKSTADYTVPVSWSIPVDNASGAGACSIASFPVPYKTTISSIQVGCATYNHAGVSVVVVAAGWFATGTAAAGGATTVDLPNSAPFAQANDYFNNYAIVITGGTGVGQVRAISLYTNANRRCTVAAWTTAPDNTSTFGLIAPGDFLLSGTTSALTLTNAMAANTAISTTLSSTAANLNLDVGNQILVVVASDAGAGALRVIQPGVVINNVKRAA